VDPDSYSAWPSKISNPHPAGRKVLLVKGISGLGNRIACALGGILYARLSGRSLVIDWSDALYSSHGDNVFHRFFTSPSCPPTTTIPAIDSVYPAIWRDRLYDSARQLLIEKRYNPDQLKRELSLNLGKVDYDEDVLVLVGYQASINRMRSHFHGPFQPFASMSDQAILTKLLREELVLQPEIRARVDAFKRGYFYSRTVGIHVRYSDYRVRIVAIVKALNRLLRREPDLQIFLATDNIEIKNMFERNYSGVITTPHWYADPGRPIHKAPVNPNCTETAIEALIDLYLLAECNHLIIDGSSSFAALASLLSPAPDHAKLDVGINRSKGNRRANSAMTQMLRRLKFSSWAFRLLPNLLPLRKL
jgi:hypothetical protein